MSKLTDRTSYLKGLADGMNLSREKDANKLILEILDVLRDMATELEEVRMDVDDLDEYMAGMNEDLLDLTEATDETCCNHHPCGSYYPDEDEAYDEDEDDEDDLLEDEDGDANVIYYECPFCRKELRLKLDEVNFSEDMPCPICGKPLFPEGFDEEQADVPVLEHVTSSFSPDDDVYADDEEDDELAAEKEEGQD